jgi:hypothetical protein
MRVLLSIINCIRLGFVILPSAALEAPLTPAEVEHLLVMAAAAPDVKDASDWRNRSSIS